MTNPIPLASPDGRVFAYACGTCLHLGSSGEMMLAHDDEAVAHLAKSSKGDADACCRCQRCNVPVFDERLTRCCGPCVPLLAAERAAAAEVWNLRITREAAHKAASLEYAKDRDAALALESAMSAISEDYYCAGWLIGLEFSLWAMVLGGPRDFGIGTVTEEEIQELRRLSDACGGWIVWRQEDTFIMGQRFMPMELWRAWFATNALVRGDEA